MGWRMDMEDFIIRMEVITRGNGRMVRSRGSGSCTTARTTLLMRDSGCKASSKGKVAYTMTGSRSRKWVSALTERISKTWRSRGNMDSIFSCWIKYTGNFHDDQKHGYGTLYFEDGSKYQGEFLKDYAHGDGRFIFADG